MPNTIPVHVIERNIQKIFSSEEMKKNNLFTSGNINPLNIIRLSTQFPSLNLSKEELVFLYDNSLATANKGFLITDSNIHFTKGYLPLDDIEQLFDKEGKLLPPFPDLPTEIQQKIATFFLALAAYKPENDTNAAKYGQERSRESAIQIKIRDNNQISPEKAIEDDIIDNEYLLMLQHEADRFVEVCERLDKDKNFKTAVQAMANNSAVIVNDPSTKELFAQDIIHIFNLVAHSDDNLTRREQFALAYNFERLTEGGDMAKSIRLDRINEMITAPAFAENIAQLRKYTIFNIQSEYPNELLLPVILSKLGHDSFSEVGAHLYRFASIVVKADGNVTPPEEEQIKAVLNLVNSPKKVIPNVKQTEFESNQTLDEVIAEMNELIGLKNIKQEVNTFINFLKVQKVREEKGLTTQKPSLHSVFIGPPGTGKTTIARLMSKIFKALGILSKGHLVETDRAGLVAGYIGQTALKVDEIVKTSLDGVLFIDEAYALSRGEGDKRDFGYEAVEALLKRMEDYRNRLVVIVAGYPDEMETFINSNPGLKSRFNRYYKFDHYTGEELLAIFKTFANKAQFKLTEDADEKLLFIFDQLYEKRSPTFGNARVARNLFEEIIERQANRIVSVAPLTEEVLMTITEEDIPSVNETVERILVFDPEKGKKQERDSYTQMAQMQKMVSQLGNVMGNAPENASADEPTAKTPPADSAKDNEDDAK